MYHVKLLNRVLLGLLVLIPGLLKLWNLFSAGSSGWFVPGFLAQLGFPAPTFFAWILMLCEIVFGIAILTNWKLKYTVWPPIIIMLVAAFTTSFNMQAAPVFLLHLV